MEHKPTLPQTWCTLHKGAGFTLYIGFVQGQHTDGLGDYLIRTIHVMRPATAVTDLRSKGNITYTLQIMSANADGNPSDGSSELAMPMEEEERATVMHADRHTQVWIFVSTNESLRVLCGLDKTRSQAFKILSNSLITFSLLDHTQENQSDRTCYKQLTQAKKSQTTDLHAGNWWKSVSTLLEYAGQPAPLELYWSEKQYTHRSHCTWSLTLSMLLYVTSHHYLLFESNPMQHNPNTAWVVALFMVALFISQFSLSCAVLNAQELTDNYIITWQPEGGFYWNHMITQLTT